MLVTPRISSWPCPLVIRLGLIGLLAGALARTLPAADASAPRPNILFILTEDQGSHAGFIGTPGIETPHMDALAAGSTYFPNAFVVYPVCSASKAAIYTGLHSHTNGLLNNTLNYHKPASEVTAAERAAPLWTKNRIRDAYPTLVELLAAAGYYQGVTHKLHVVPNEKFPYNEFIEQTNGATFAAFLDRAKATGKPWFYLYNISESHRPFPNSDSKPIRVSPVAVKLAGFLPDTPVVRQDWAEYLAAIEIADHKTGEALAALHAAGLDQNTLIVFLGDHGPCFQHGKMTLHDLGLRVPLLLRVPGQPARRLDNLVTELDLMPTLLDYAGVPAPALQHGRSLRPLLDGRQTGPVHDYVFAEISNRGPLPNNGMQERSVTDGRWKLIYREKTATNWRQVQADAKDFKPWGNRTYAETVRVKAEFPEAYRILAEMDPQSLGGTTPTLELYDLRADPDELHNLANQSATASDQQRLLTALAAWARKTEDPAVPLLIAPTP